MKEIDRLARYKAVYEARVLHGKKVREVAEEFSIWPNQVSRDYQQWQRIAKRLDLEIAPRRHLTKQCKRGADAQPR